MKQPSWCIADLDEKGPALERIETDDGTWSDLKQFQGQKLWPTEPDCNAVHVWTTKIVICICRLMCIYINISIYIFICTLENQHTKRWDVCSVLAPRNEHFIADRAAAVVWPHGGSRLRKLPLMQIGVYCTTYIRVMVSTLRIPISQAVNKTCSLFVIMVYEYLLLGSISSSLIR